MSNLKIKLTLPKSQLGGEDALYSFNLTEDELSELLRIINATWNGKYDLSSVTCTRLYVCPTDFGAKTCSVFFDFNEDLDLVHIGTLNTRDFTDKQAVQLFVDAWLKSASEKIQQPKKTKAVTIQSKLFLKSYGDSFKVFNMNTNQQRNLVKILRVNYSDIAYLLVRPDTVIMSPTKHFLTIRVNDTMPFKILCLISTQLEKPTEQDILKTLTKVLK